MKIHKEGYKSIALATLIFGGINIISFYFFSEGTPLISWIIFGVSLVLLLFIISFFRSPKREFTIAKHQVICPADGKVVVIEETVDEEYFKEKRIQVSIFMSPANVHINRIPMSGNVEYSQYHKGKYLVVDGNDYIIDGKKIDNATKEAIRSIGSQFDKAESTGGIASIKNYGTDFVLLFESEPVAYLNHQLVLPDGKVLDKHDLYRLRKWAEHIRDGRGDFFVKGEYGKDFSVFYKSKELTYKNRTFYLGDQKLSPYLLNKAMDSADTASSYIYVITFLHLLHIVVTLLFMIRTVTYSYLGKYTNGDVIGLKATGIFWHFLDFLWLFLLLFLVFIH